MRVYINISRPEDEASAQLKRIPAQLVLPVAGCAGAVSRVPIIFSQQMKQIGFLEARNLIGLALLVDEQREMDAGLFAKELGIGSIAQSHGR